MYLDTPGHQNVSDRLSAIEVRLINGLFDTGLQRILAFFSRDLYTVKKSQWSELCHQKEYVVTKTTMFEQLLLRHNGTNMIEMFLSNELQTSSERGYTTARWRQRVNCDINWFARLPDLSFSKTVCTLVVLILME